MTSVLKLSISLLWTTKNFYIWHSPFWYTVVDALDLVLEAKFYLCLCNSHWYN